MQTHSLSSQVMRSSICYILRSVLLLKLFISLWFKTNRFSNGDDHSLFDSKVVHRKPPKCSLIGQTDREADAYLNHLVNSLSPCFILSISAILILPTHKVSSEKVKEGTEGIGVNRATFTSLSGNVYFASAYLLFTLHAETATPAFHNSLLHL